jgi:hypothetical protein
MCVYRVIGHISKSSCSSGLKVMIPIGLGTRITVLARASSNLAVSQQLFLSRAFGMYLSLTGKVLWLLLLLPLRIRLSGLFPFRVNSKVTNLIDCW